MSLRRRGYLLEMVVARETAHIGRMLKLDLKQAKRLVAIFFGAGKPEKFERVLKKKMPVMSKQFPVGELFQYLVNVFG